MDVEGILAIVLIFGGGTLWLLSLSPVGKALAERIRAPAAPGAAGAAVDCRGGRARPEPRGGTHGADAADPDRPCGDRRAGADRRADRAARGDALDVPFAHRGR